MGAPTKTVFEALTDCLAAKVQLDINGFLSESSGQTLLSLADQVDAMGDLFAEAAIMDQAIDVDEMSLPANMYNWLSTITNRTEYKAFARALNDLVISDTGGDYASLRAYLVDKGVLVHPLAGELFRKAVSDGAFTSSSVVAGISTPYYGCMFPTRVYTGADGTLAADLADALSATTGDVALFANDDEALYIGSNRPFQAIVVALSTLSSADITATFQYWNGNAWSTLTVTDNTVGFTKNDIITFTPPADWTRSYMDAASTVLTAKERLYYVRIARTANTVVTTPIGTCITLVPTALYRAANSTQHLCYDQPPLAVYRITGTNAMSLVGAYANIDVARFAPPLGSDAKIRLRALTAIASNLTPTLFYTDGVDVDDTKAQGAWTAPAALGTAVVTLNTGDTLKAIRAGSTVTTAATVGVFAVEVTPIRTPAI